MTEKQITHYMKTLDLTREQAIALIRDDEYDVSVDLTAEQKKVVKKMTQGDRKKETTPRKREAKVDTDKRFLIDHFNALLNDLGMDNVAIINTERQIDFIFNDAHYSVTLTKHRKEKAK